MEAEAEEAVPVAHLADTPPRTCPWTMTRLPLISLLYFPRRVLLPAGTRELTHGSAGLGQVKERAKRAPRAGQLQECRPRSTVASKRAAEKQRAFALAHSAGQRGLSSEWERPGAACAKTAAELAAAAPAPAAALPAVRYPRPALDDGGGGGGKLTLGGGTRQARHETGWVEGARPGSSMSGWIQMPDGHPAALGDATTEKAMDNAQEKTALDPEEERKRKRSTQVLGRGEAERIMHTTPQLNCAHQQESM